MDVKRIVIIIICFLATFLSKLITEYIDDKNSDNNKEVKKKGKKSRHERINVIIPHSLLVTVFEMLIVFFGAFLAIQFTAQLEKSKSQEIALLKLKYVGEDYYNQSFMLQSLVEMYKSGEITYDFLEINASIDTSLVEELLFKDELISIMPEYGYEVLLANYRQMNDYISHLDLEINKDPETKLDIYREMVACASGYIYCSNQLIRLRKTKEITEAEYYDIIKNYVKTVSNDPGHLWVEENQQDSFYSYAD